MSYANAPIVLNVRDLTSGQYNNAQFNATNQNIIQGDIREIAVSEINFPYDIPNIQAGYNTFELISADVPVPPASLRSAPTLTSDPGYLIITITPGFYTGQELETAINDAIEAEQISVGGVAADAPTIEYNAVSNRFTFLAPASPAVTPTWSVFSPYTYPYDYRQQTNTLGKDILSIMGFLPVPAGTPQAGYSSISANDPNIPPTFSGGSAPLAFTLYIDVCSPKMCQYQYFRDGSTTNLARRADVICRLFICDNVSLTQTSVEGTRPFIINRQFFNARIMRWTTENSVGTIDIQLYDDVGQPLTTTWSPRPYQITFNCYERDKEDDKVAEDMPGGKPPARYASYQERNVSQAWRQLSRQ
jgi:hypothetical protein